jgi:hypothetical protein
MVEYIKYKGKNFPFCITMSALVEFKKATNEDFELSLSGDIDKIYSSMLMMTILALHKGFELEKPSFLRILWNLITTGTKIGIKNSEYVRLLDTEYEIISKTIPLFFGQLSEEDKKK